MTVASVKMMMLYQSQICTTSSSIREKRQICSSSSSIREKRQICSSSSSSSSIHGRQMVMVSSSLPLIHRQMVMVSSSLPLIHRQMVMMSALDEKKKKRHMVMMSALDEKRRKKAANAVPNSNYVVPMDKAAASCITRPLAEILRDLNKRIPDNILDLNSKHLIPWYHANRMLSFYAPGWCGEVRDVIFADDGSVTVVYRVTIRGSDGEAYRESTGTILSSDPHSVDQVAAAEESAFVRACARFGLGLYLYHEE